MFSPVRTWFILLNARHAFELGKADLSISLDYLAGCLGSFMVGACLVFSEDSGRWRSFVWEDLAIVSGSAA